jgi:hypothetical protein
MLAAKFIAAALVFAAYLLLPGCVTLGYDFLRAAGDRDRDPKHQGLAK